MVVTSDYHIRKLENVQMRGALRQWHTKKNPQAMIVMLFIGIWHKCSKFPLTRTWHGWTDR